MAQRQPEQFTPQTPPRVGDTVVLRPTSRQRIGSATLKALCAAPLILALPVTSGKAQTVVITVAVLSALAAAAIDVLAQRDIWLKISPAGIATRAGSVPWWAIDEICVNDRSSVETVVVRCFDTIEMTLPAPRNGPTGSNPHFPDEVRLLVGNWRRYAKVRPGDGLDLTSTLERARALVDQEIIDLRPDAGSAVDNAPAKSGAGDVHGSGPEPAATAPDELLEGRGGKASDEHRGRARIGGLLRHG